MFERLYNERARAFAERYAVRTVKGVATVFVERVESQKARVRNGSERVRTAGDNNVGFARSDKVRGVSNAYGTCRASVCNVSYDSARFNAFRNRVCDRGNRHFLDIFFGFTFRIVMFYALYAAYAASHDNACLFVAVKLSKSGVRESFLRGFYR